MRKRGAGHCCGGNLRYVAEPDQIGIDIRLRVGERVTNAGLRGKMNQHAPAYGAQRVLPGSCGRPHPPLRRQTRDSGVSAQAVLPLAWIVIRVEVVHADHLFPRSSSRVATCEPMKPAAPVMSTFIKATFGDRFESGRPAVNYTGTRRDTRFGLHARSHARLLHAPLLCAQSAARARTGDACARRDIAEILRLTFPAAESGFDPVKVSDYYSGTIIEAIFEPLLTYDYLARPVKLVPNVLKRFPRFPMTEEPTRSNYGAESTSPRILCSMAVDAS